jgi:DNA-binding HxlR family transcriptional regulator
MPTTIQLTGRLEPRSAWEADDCSLARSLDVVRTRSGFLLLREAFYGATRFDEFAPRAGVSEPVAAARLRELVDHGLLERFPYRETGQRTRQGYRLTEMGQELLPALVGLMQWGDRWLHDHGGPIELRHRGCGARVEAELRCAEGHRAELAELEAAVTPRRAHRRSPARHRRTES